MTSPAALLGSMFGSGEELSNVEFAVGRASIDAAATKLESLAKALVERNSLKLEITGRADPRNRPGRSQARRHRAGDEGREIEGPPHRHARRRQAYPPPRRVESLRRQRAARRPAAGVSALRTPVRVPIAAGSFLKPFNIAAVNA